MSTSRQPAVIVAIRRGEINTEFRNPGIPAGGIPGTSMSKPLSRRSRDFFAGVPNIYSASPGSGRQEATYGDFGDGIPIALRNK